LLLLLSRRRWGTAASRCLADGNWEVCRLQVSRVAVDLVEIVVAMEMVVLQRNQLASQQSAATPS